MDKKKRDRRYIPRETRKFQLRLDDPTDIHVREVLHYAKAQRRQLTMIRNGIRLMWALENDDLSILFELFPNLKGRFLGNADDLLEQFRQMLLQHQPATPEIYGIAGVPAGNPKPLPAPKVAMPTFDDEDTIIIRRDTSAGVSAAANFLDAAFGIQEKRNH
jgi:hypothetical protein